MRAAIRRLRKNTKKQILRHGEIRDLKYVYILHILHAQTVEWEGVKYSKIDTRY